MRILVVGGGGREHALCWALQRESADSTIYCAPGNPGTGLCATNIPIAITDQDGLSQAASTYGIDLVVVGPEEPLALGLADRLRASGCRVFGPNAAAAQLEASKSFAKDVMAAAGVPTAASSTFTDLSKATAFIESHAEPLVVKASGLAMGKGVVVCSTRKEATQAARAMLGGAYGEAGRAILVEEFLMGEEISVVAITNGSDLIILPIAQDHKRLLEGDGGPNTGGMGAYSPVGLASRALLERVIKEVFQPTLLELERRRTPFRGALYAGLMVDRQGAPWVIEFNCRFGDPETQVMLPRVSGGLTDAFWAAASGEELPAISVTRDTAVTTVLAAKGYPDQVERGATITLPDLPEDVLVFHAATTRGRDGVLRVNGGRVLALTGVATTFHAAQAASRVAAERVQFDGKQFRRDIGWRESARR